jgi:hypothetical protein
MIVYAGIVDMAKFTENGTPYQAVTVANSTIYPGYRKNENENDIGLLLLSNKLKFTGKLL